MPTLPEDGTTFTVVTIMLSWTASYSLGPDQFFEVRLRYTHDGEEVVLPTYTQTWQWFVDPALYLQADQETNRAYYWHIRTVLKGTDSAGKVTYIPISPISEERVFYWK